MKKNYLLVFLIIFAGSLFGQSPVKVQKTNPKPIYMHYMPWFDTPQTSGNGQWGWHWKMDKMDPNIVDQTGKRQIASHYYPLIGPYASSDPYVIQYHLLLMKLSGIDGILIDWYGSEGSNGDLANLLRNSDSIVNHTAEAAMMFGLILEDRFWVSLANGKNSLSYAKDHYFNKTSYFRYGSGNHPLVGVFGPNTFQTGLDWTTILSGAGEDVVFLPLEYQGGEGDPNTDGEYAWPYQSPNTTDHYSQVENFYKNRAPQLNIAMGEVYPSFNDFYAQGQNGGTSYFYIPSNNGRTLDTLINLSKKYNSDIDIMQLATWNDYGEGTMFEPTRENGYSYLVQIQRYTGVAYTECDLMQVNKYYNLRKKNISDITIQLKLDQVFKYFAALQITNAVNLMNTIDPTSPCVATGLTNVLETSLIELFPNPVTGELRMQGIDQLNIVSIRIADIIGREVQMELSPGTLLNMSALEPGVYFIRIVTKDNRTIIKQFMKQ